MSAATEALGPVPGVLSSAPRVTYAARMDDRADDSALMLRYRDGDVGAFETLYRRHNDALYRYLLRHCGNAATAEDLYQEVWSRVIRARERYVPSAKFSTYLYRIAHNCFIDHVRRHKHEYDVGHKDPDLLEAATAEPAQSVEKSLARRRLDAALRDIPAEQRDAFLLREEGGLSLEQIARVCGTNRETVKSRLRYAQNKLRKALLGQADTAMPGERSASDQREQVK